MNALDTLVEGLFDYAGMFPPASLPLEEAVARSAAFRSSLGRPRLAGADLVAPAERLADLDAAGLARLGWPSGRTFRLCVLGPSLGAPADSQAAASKAAAAYAAQGQADRERPRRAVSFEVKAPAAWDARAAAEAAAAARQGLSGGTRLFVEPQWDRAGWARHGAALCAALEERNAAAGASAFGLKVRGSGPTAVTVSILAGLLPEVDGRTLPFKATAGLHHPLIEARYGNELGFLGLAAALRLLRCLGAGWASPGKLEACLGAADPAEFDFDGGLSWRGEQAGTGTLTTAVEEVPFSIGSCSLDEPDQDLQRLFP